MCIRDRTCAYCKSYAELEAVTAKTVADAAYSGDETATEVYKTLSLIHIYTATLFSIGTAAISNPN